MEILFSQMDNCINCDCGAAEGAFVDQSGSSFYYKLEMLDTESVAIVDTCGRYVPFAFEDIPELIFALQGMERIAGGPIKALEQALSTLEDLKIAI